MFILTQSYKGGVKRTSTGALNHPAGFQGTPWTFFAMKVIAKGSRGFFAAQQFLPAAFPIRLDLQAYGQLPGRGEPL